MKTKGRALDWEILALGVLAAAFNTIFARMGYQSGADAISFSICTLITSLAFFILFTLISPHKGIRMVSGKEWKKLLWLALVATILGMNFFYVGTSYTTATNASFLVRLQSPFMLLFAFLMISEKISGKHLLAMALMLGGGYLISMKGLGFNPQLGDVFVVISALLFGYTNIYFKKELAHLSAQLALLGRFGISAPILAIGGYLFLGPAAFSALSTALPFVIAAAACYAIYMFGMYRSIDKIGATPTALAMLVSPLVTGIAAFFVLGEILTLIQYAGGALILIGGYLLAR